MVPSLTGACSNCQKFGLFRLGPNSLESSFGCHCRIPAFAGITSMDNRKLFSRTVKKMLIASCLSAPANAGMSLEHKTVNTSRKIRWSPEIF